MSKDTHRRMKADSEVFADFAWRYVNDDRVDDKAFRSLIRWHPAVADKPLVPDPPAGDVEEIARGVVEAWQHDPNADWASLRAAIASALSSERTASSAQERVLVEALDRHKSDREYVIGWNDGFDHAMTEDIAPMLKEVSAALKGVIAVADRKTNEFDAARAAIAMIDAALAALHADGGAT